MSDIIYLKPPHKMPEYITGIYECGSDAFQTLFGPEDPERQARHLGAEVWVPLHPGLQTELASTERRGETIMAALLEAGCTNCQAKAITGHSTDQMVNLYTKKVNQRRQARDIGRKG